MLEIRLLDNSPKQNVLKTLFYTSNVILFKICSHYFIFLFELQCLPRILNRVRTLFSLCCFTISVFQIRLLVLGIPLYRLLTNMHIAVVKMKTTLLHVLSAGNAFPLGVCSWINVLFVTRSLCERTWNIVSSVNVGNGCKLWISTW